VQRLVYSGCFRWVIAIFFVVLTTVFKKNRNNPPVTKGWQSWFAYKAILCYLATGLWFRFVNFLQQTGTGRRIQENKCEAAGGFLQNEMTLRSMGNGMEEKMYLWS
jgi:hypothetical protein